MLPVLLLAVAGVLQLGVLRFVAARVAAAADLAALVAVNDQDDAELERSGRLRLAASAVEVAREQFARGLAHSSAFLAAPPDRIASGAAIVAVPGGPDGTGRPSLRITAQVPVRAPVFGALALPGVIPIAVIAASSPR